MSPAPRQTPLNVVLVGFMGSGKTTLGARLAEKLGFSFIDMDHCIVRRAGRSIPRIFETEGESGFRQFESAVLEELTRTTRRAVIATGGGVVTVPDNVPLLRSLGYIIWLNPGARTIFQRVKRNRERPLLRTADPRETVRELLEVRRPLYEAIADLETDTHGLTPDEAAYGLAETVRLHFAQCGTAPAPSQASAPPQELPLPAVHPKQ